MDSTMGATIVDALIAILGRKTLAVKVSKRDWSFMLSPVSCTSLQERKEFDLRTCIFESCRF